MVGEGMRRVSEREREMKKTGRREGEGGFRSFVLVAFPFSPFRWEDYESQWNWFSTFVHRAEFIVDLHVLIRGSAKRAQGYLIVAKEQIP